MTSALHSNKKCLSIFLHHIGLYQKCLYKDEIGDILHHESNFGDTLLALVLQQGGRLGAAEHLLMDMEREHHLDEAKGKEELVAEDVAGNTESGRETGKDREADAKAKERRKKEVKEEGKRKLTACLQKHLTPSIEVQKALHELDNSLQKSTCQKALIWIRVFFKSLLIPVALLVLDVAFDGLLVHMYHDYKESNLLDQYHMCKEAAINRLRLNSTQLYDNTCEANWSSSMPFVCIPLALDKYSRFNYSLVFVLSPWIFYHIEYSLSKYWADSVKVNEIFLNTKMTDVFLSRKYKKRNANSVSAQVNSQSNCSWPLERQ